MKCAICNEFLPPGFTQPTEDRKASKCVFCEREIKFVEATNPSTGEHEHYTKNQVVEEYKRYLKKLYQNPNVRQVVVDDAVNSMKQQ